MSGSGLMGALGESHAVLAARWEELRADFTRLRLEFLNIEIDLSHTLLGLADARRNEITRWRSLDAARRGYDTAVRLTNQLSPETQADLSERLERLRSVLDSKAKPDDHLDADQADELSPEPAMTAPAPSPAMQGGEQAEALQRLTRREVDVLTCIARGQSTKEAAYSLGITFKTAACHRYHVMTKLNLHDTASLVRFAIRHGLVEP